MPSRLTNALRKLRRRLMNISLPYGSDRLMAPLEWAGNIDVLDMADAPAIPDLSAALRNGLNHPIGPLPPLGSALRAERDVLIVVSDSFRKTGADHFLPPLLDYLAAHGVSDERISFLFATGTHRPPTEQEKAVILGEAVYARFQDRAQAHDPRDKGNLVFKGATSRGTPVYVNRRAAEAGCLILTGTVVLHYFGGFGGGRKAMLPGIAGLETIAANHALNLDPVENRLNAAVAIGRLAGNPVAEDMLEGALLGPPCFLINTVLNRQGRISGLFCGDLQEAHEAACGIARAQFAIPIREQADLVVASAGAAKNFVQSHKALYNAFQAAKPDGVIVLAAPAPEGYGGNRFVEWLSLGNRDAIIEELRKNAEINGQTALSTLEKARKTIFVTGLSSSEVQALGGEKAEHLSAALAMAQQRLAEAGVQRPACYVMPSAGYTVPFLAPQ